MPCEELDIVWNNIKAEARALADCEPMLASFYHATLLKHENLGSALSYMLANKLASPIMPAIAIREVVEEAYAADPEMIASAACDIQAVRTRDPAVDKYSTPLLYLKGFHALQAYRIGHWLWTQGRRALAIFLQNQVSVSFQVDIHPAAKIGRGIMLDHATGIVVGETAVIEDDVSILQSVTLGGTGKTSGRRVSSASRRATSRRWIWISISTASTTPSSTATGFDVLPFAAAKHRNVARIRRNAP